MSDPGDFLPARSPELQALIDEIAAEAAREKALRAGSAGSAGSAGTPAAPVPADDVTAKAADDFVPPAAGAVPGTTVPVAEAAAAASPADAAPAPAAVAPVQDQQDAIALSVAAPQRPRRAMALAGGVAAAVVAIVAITVGNRLAAVPSSSVDQKLPVGYAVVGSVGSDGRSTAVTVTAPMTTVGGKLVALVAGADGTTRQAPVLTVLSSTPATSPPADSGTSPSGTSATTPSAPSSGAGNSAALNSAAGNSGAGARTAGSTSPDRTGRPGSPGPVPAAGDTATVVTGTSRLTGWAPVPTTIGPPPGTRPAGNPTQGGGSSHPAGPSVPNTSAAPNPGAGGGSTATSPSRTSTSAGSGTGSSPVTPTAPSPPVPGPPQTTAPGSTAGGTGTSGQSIASTCIAISLPPVSVAGGLLPTSINFPCP